VLVLSGPCHNHLHGVVCAVQLIQRRCQVCNGSGLVQRGRYQRKCPQCGGFFPWISWSMFLSANASPGNGGEAGAAAAALSLQACCKRDRCRTLSNPAWHVWVTSACQQSNMPTSETCSIDALHMNAQ
jgi:hypothetical protein